MSSPLDSIEREALLERVLDEAAARARAGETPLVEDYAEKYPEIAEEIREMLPVLVRLESPANVTGSPPPHADQLFPGQVLDDYRLVRFLGRGGMGVVYEARQLSLDRSVALKLLPNAPGDMESLKKRFELEARTAARLLHPHIVAVHDFGEVDNFAFYAMQLVDGTNLGEVIRALRRGPDHRNEKSDEKSAGRNAEGRVANSNDDGLAGALAAALRMGVVDGRARRSSTADTGDLSAGITEVDADREKDSSAPPSEHAPAPSSSSSSSSSPPSSRENVHHRDATGGRYFASIARMGSLVADALSHAHAAGVLHRDIKPSNLLLDRRGKVWVADFGLAKLEDGEGLTQSGDAVGTLRYMGPERFRGWSDPRSDVYSLGATLFELASLEPPFDDRDRARLIKKTLENDAPRPRSIDARIPRDFETVILKCLEKEPARRYASAADLRDDLDRFIEGRPVQARLATSLERVWLFARRNPVVSALVMALLIFAVVVTMSAVRLNRTTRELRGTTKALEGEKNRALDNLYEAQVAQAEASRKTADPTSRSRVLGMIAEAAAYRSSLELRNVAIPWISGIGLEIETEVQVPALGPAAVSPSADFIAWPVGRDILLRSLADGSERRMERAETSESWALEFSPGGEYLLIRCRAGRTEILQIADGSSMTVLDRGNARFEFHPTKPLVAVMHDGGVRTYELPSGEKRPLSEWAKDAGWMAFGPRGERVALANRSGRVLSVHDASTGQRLHRFEQPPSRFDDRIKHITWHPEGRLIATGWRPVVVWDLDSGTTRLVNEDKFLQRIAFSPDGEFLATSGWPGAARSSRVFESRSGHLLSKLLGEFIGFDLESQRVFLRDGATVRVARIERDESHRAFDVADSSVHANFWVAFDPSGRWLATGRASGIYIWDIGRSRLVARMPIGDTNWVGWSEDGTKLLSSGKRGTWWWRWNIGSTQVTVGPPRRVCSSEGWFASCGIGERVVVSTPGGIHIHHLSRRASDFTLPIFHDAGAPTLSKDGRYLACGSFRSGTEIRVWDLDTRQVVHRELDVGTAFVAFVDKTRVFVGNSHTCRLLEVGSWKTLESVDRKVLHAAVNNGTLIVSAPPATSASLSSATVVTLLDLDHGLEPLAELEIGRHASALAVGPRGQLLAVGTNEGGPVHLWRLDTIRPRLRELGLDWDPPLDKFADRSAPESLDVEVNLGELDPGRALEAEFEKAQAAIDEKPEDAAVLLRFARAAQKFGSWNLAISAYEKTLDKTFTYRVANELAWWYVISPEEYRDLDRSLTLVTRALELKPDYWPALNTLGVVQVRRKAWHEAVEALQQSIEAAPMSKSTPGDYYPLSIALHHLDRKSMARVAFNLARQTAALQEYPDDDFRAEMRAFHIEAAAVLNDDRPIPASLEE